MYGIFFLCTPCPSQSPCLNPLNAPSSELLPWSPFQNHRKKGEKLINPKMLKRVVGRGSQTKGRRGVSRTIHLMTPTSHPNRYTQTLFQLYNNFGISTDPLYSRIQTPSQIPLKNTSTYCSLPHQGLLPSP